MVVCPRRKALCLVPPRLFTIPRFMLSRLDCHLGIYLPAHFNKNCSFTGVRETNEVANDSQIIHPLLHASVQWACPALQVHHEIRITFSPVLWLRRSQTQRQRDRDTQRGRDREKYAKHLSNWIIKQALNSSSKDVDSGEGSMASVASYVALAALVPYPGCFFGL